MHSKNKIRKIISFSLFFFVLLFAMLLICETADARAGGGHGYSGGGGSSGGSGGGGGGGELYLLIQLIRLAIECPIIGVPLLIIVVGFMIYGYMKGDEMYVGNTIRKGTELYPSVASNSALTKIKAKDPNFDENHFRQRAENAFMLVQRSWAKRDLADAEAFLADGTYEQFLIQINTYKENRVIDVMENLKIRESYIMGFESDNNFDTIHLAIRAVCKNYRADEKSKQYIEGNRSEEEFTEVWTFLRRTGAKTLKKPGLIEGYCPNCGAKIVVGRHARCSSCNAILRSGEYDWVLSNITQACEWTERSNNAIPGVKRYLQLDEGFNVQHIEDLVSVMFWRKNESERIGDVAPLRKIATNEYCDSQANMYRPDSNGQHKFFTESAIGSIRLMGVDDVTSDQEDFLYAKVIWSGIPAKRGRDGKILKVVNLPQNFKDVFVLKRKHGVKTDTKTSLSSAHCPNCGAAITNLLANECEYCGSVLNDGKRDWVLECILPQADPRIAKAIVLIRASDSKSSTVVRTGPAGVGIKKNYTVDDYSSSINKISGMTMIKWTVAMMLADGIIDAKEQEIIYEYGLRRGIGKDKINSIVEEIRSHDSPVEYVAETTDLPMDDELIRMIVRVAFADGKVVKQEIDMLRFVGKKLNLTDTQIRNILAEEKMRLYRMSKAIVSESKKYN